MRLLFLCCSCCHMRRCWEKKGCRLELLEGYFVSKLSDFFGAACSLEGDLRATESFFGGSLYLGG